jgi:hypothetical protein
MIFVADRRNEKGEDCVIGSQSPPSDAVCYLKINRDRPLSRILAGLRQ